jgi:AcrR family transcriptional regulator
LLARTGNRDAVSVRAVAELVGVTAPSIYMHFKDKEGLLDAVCAEHFAALGRALAQAAAEAPNPVERLLAQGRAYVRFALAQPEEYRLSTMVSGRPGSVDQVIGDACFGQLLATVAKCTEAGIFAESADGGLDLGLRLWSAVHGIASLLVCKAWLPWGDTDALVERILRVTLVGNTLADQPRQDWDRLGEALAPLWEA